MYNYLTSKTTRLVIRKLTLKLTSVSYKYRTHQCNLIRFRILLLSGSNKFWSIFTLLSYNSKNLRTIILLGISGSIHIPNFFKNHEIKILCTGWFALNGPTIEHCILKTYQRLVKRRIILLTADIQNLLSTNY